MIICDFTASCEPLATFVVVLDLRRDPAGRRSSVADRCNGLVFSKADWTLPSEPRSSRQVNHTIHRTDASVSTTGQPKSASFRAAPYRASGFVPWRMRGIATDGEWQSLTASSRTLVSHPMAYLSGHASFRVSFDRTEHRYQDGRSVGYASQDRRGCLDRP